MKAITLALFMLFGAFLFSGCSETKDTSDATKNEVTNEVKSENSQTENSSKEELTMKEKAGEESANEKVSTDKYEDKTKQLKAKDSKLESASFTAESMHCTGCETSIENSVRKLNGVQDVQASFDTKQIEVVYAGDKVTKEDIAKAITDSGFECKVNN